MARPSDRPPVPAVRRSVEEFLALIDGLVRRPRRFDRGLPLIWLTGDKDSRDVLNALVKRITETTSRYRVPYTRLRASRGASPAQGLSQSAHNPDIRPLLHAACVDLSKQKFGGERLRFRHYALVEWLMSQNLSPLALEDAPNRLEKLLRKRHRRPGLQPDGGEAATAAADLYLLLILTAGRIVPRLLFRAAVSGRRLPLFGRHYRWLVRQRYLAPRQSGSFVGFAERLTDGVWQFEDPKEVNKLLVHAFLEDLRRAYTRRPWRVEGWRRTAYPLMLIENVDHGTDGCLLMQLINSVRNETGRGDPLLAICTSNDGPPAADTNSHRLVELSTNELAADERRLRESDAAYKTWAEALPQSRRARTRTAWNFPVAVPDAARAEHIVGPPITPAKPPWFARRAIPVAVIVALVASVAAWVGWESGGFGCTHRPFVGDIAVRDIDGECIGYSDNDGFLFNDEPGQDELLYIQNKIFEQNHEVREQWENSGRQRPLVTMIYLGSLTGRDTNKDEEAYAAEREELEGLAIAQRNGLSGSGSAYGSALLRIVIANGGKEMRHAREAVKMIEDLARRDPTVVAVVGLVDSRDSTADALKDLNRAGLPAIATTLSADRFHNNSRLYLQLAPPNIDQANMLYEYATKVLDVPETRVYFTFYTDGGAKLEDDYYVDTLVADIQKVFGDKGAKIEYVRRFQNQPLTDECGYSGMLVFAGRWSHFDGFVQQLKSSCDTLPQHLVADDSVNRYMANRKLRDNAPNLRLAFVSKAQLGTCKRLHNAAAEPSGEARSRFLALIREDNLLKSPRCAGGEPDGGEPVGERVPLAYDAAMLVVQAVERLAGRLRTGEQEWDPQPIRPVAVHAEILGHNRSSAFHGVTGSIRFRPETGEPVDKRISILEAASIPDVDAPFVEVFHCGVDRPNDVPSCRKP
jgi:ABC-type branched-subunit amino acid transport system substrate-binding protein